MLRVTCFLTLLSAIFLLVRLLFLRLISAQTMYRLWLAFPIGILLYVFSELISRNIYYDSLVIQFCTNKNPFLRKTIALIWFVVSAHLALHKLFLTHKFNSYLNRIRVYSNSIQVRFRGLFKAKPEKTFRVYDINNSIYACSLGKRIYIDRSVRTDDLSVADAITKHELKHCMNHDFLWNIFRVLLSSFFWFNPLIILACRLSEQDMEAACDEYALNDTPTELRKKYAYTLIAAAEENNRCFTPCYSSHKASLYNRISRFITREPSFQCIAVSILLVLLIPVVTLFLIPPFEYIVVSNPNAFRTFTLIHRF